MRKGERGGILQAVRKGKEGVGRKGWTKEREGRNM